MVSIKKDIRCEAWYYATVVSMKITFKWCAKSDFYFQSHICQNSHSTKGLALFLAPGNEATKGYTMDFMILGQNSADCKMGITRMLHSC